MSKALFRFMRGELNGFYIQNIQNMMNQFTKDIKDFFYEFKAQQFETGMISDETLNNLGKFAGVHLMKLSTTEALSAIKLTEGFKSGETEIGERGLFVLDTETFSFEDGEVLPDGVDINTYSTEELRSSLVGDEEVLGYIDYTATDVIDDEGKIRPDKILSEPPQNSAYSEYYGNNFMFLSEAVASYSDISSTLLLELFKALQWVRYNGASITSLCRIIDIVCPNGLITIDSIEAVETGSRFYVYYTYNEDAYAELKQQRLFLLQYIIRLKFMQVELVES